MTFAFPPGLRIAQIAGVEIALPASTSPIVEDAIAECVQLVRAWRHWPDTDDLRREYSARSARVLTLAGLLPADGSVIAAQVWRAVREENHD